MIQNKALRLIPSAFSSTLIAALEIQTNIEHLGLEEKSTYSCNLKNASDCHSCTSNNIFPLQDNLNHTILSIRDLMNKYNINTNIPQRPLGFRENFPPALSLPSLNFSINFPEKKSVALYAYALENIMTLYPKDTWLHV
ncbi:hypothetical protein TNCV_345531 [Trichonephila clavipes]|nr:hypothetical protein TNCV_345531 [Trichonephila clavipes]